MIRKPLLLGVAIGSLTLAMACSSPEGDDARGPAAAADTTKAAAVTPAVLERGKALYKTNCAACHGETGKGDGPASGALKPAPRDHTDRAYMSTLTDEDLAKIIQMGGAIKGKPLMPSNPQIRGSDLEAVVAYTRSLSTPEN